MRLQIPFFALLFAITPPLSAQLAKIDRIASQAMVAIYREAVPLNAQNAVLLGVAKYGSWDSGSLRELPSFVSPYTIHFSAFNASKNEFARARMEAGIKEAIDKEHRQILGRKYFSATFHGVKLGPYSFSQRGFPLPKFDDAMPIRIKNLDNPIFFPTFIPVHEAEAEAFIKASPDREVRITFVFENSMIDTNIRENYPDIRKFIQPLYGDALFCVVETFFRQKPGTGKVLSVITNPAIANQQVLTYSKQAQLILDKLDKPADLKNENDVFSTYNYTPVDYFALLEGVLKHCETLGIPLTSEAESAKTKYIEARDSRLQVFFKVLSQKRWYYGKYGSEKGDFGICLGSFNQETGVVLGKYYNGEEESDLQAVVEHDVYGPLLKIGRGTLLRLRGRNQLCGGNGIGAMGLSTKVYLLLDSDNKPPGR